MTSSSISMRRLPKVRTAGRDAIAVVAALGSYQTTVLPLVRRESRRWRSEAGGIPDATLRRQALAAVTEKAPNVEAIAVFAILAPRRFRPAAIRAMVALQTAIDYLDTLGEQADANTLRNGLQLHSALSAAVSPGAERDDWYRHHPQQEDGGYLNALVAACQEGAGTLPSRDAVLPHAANAAKRCGEGQTRTHVAAATRSTERLDAWGAAQGASAIFCPWEVTAGASSSVAAHALIAAAADPRSDSFEAAAIDAAYFPAVGALTVLLDDLVDRDKDAAAGEHSYMDRYRSAAVAADRLDLILGLARGSLGHLRRSHRHAAILTGIVAYYLSSPSANSGFAEPVRARLLASSGPELRLISSFLRSRRGG